MIETWRTQLYFLGFFASLAFAARFTIQWLASEKRRKSYVPPLFWKLSLVGNLLFALHAFIQIQVHICLVQSYNAIFSWRNLNLMKEPQQQASFKTTVFLIGISTLSVLTIFTIQGLSLYGHYDWVRTPTMPWNNTPGEKLSLLWHILGSIGIFLFSSRFWIQWWQAEKNNKSSLGITFWQVSITGALISLLYFIKMYDVVNILGQIMSIIPAIRNLQLIHKQKKPLGKL